MEAVLVAAIVALASMGSAILVAHSTNSQRTKEQEADWERQDVVANRLLAANERVAESTAEAGKKLDVIHGLVNSSMTAAMQGELDALRREHIQMVEIIRLNKEAGRTPSQDALAAVEATKQRIAEQSLVLDERKRQGERIAEQADPTA